MDETQARPNNARLCIVQWLEMTLFVAVFLTATFNAMLYAAGNGSIFSLWIAVLLGAMAFSPLARRRLISGSWKAGHERERPLGNGAMGAIHLAQGLLFIFAAITAAVAWWYYFKRTGEASDLWAFAILGVMALWPMIPSSILNGYRPQ